MRVVQYGDWKIAVDVEKTKEYYAAYPKKNEQANRNFALYCEKLSAEEREFFDAFGIDPLCCEIEHIGVDKKGNFPFGGYYLVCGTYLERPPENLITLEEFAEKNFEDDRPDPRINIGMFQFSFQCEDYVLHFIPEDLPEGFLCIQFWCENMKWLLKETPEERMYEPLRFWEIHEIVKRRIAYKKRAAKELENMKRFFSDELQKLGIRAVLMDAKEVPKYKKRWIREFTPEGTDGAVVHEIKKNCLYSAKYSVYLWHIFSYGYLSCDEKEEAKKQFNRKRKDCCVLLSNWDGIAYKLENAQSLTAEQLERFVDVTVTASDFSWTYTKTHEGYCGPYFYNK